MDTIGERIKTRRKEIGMSVEALARAAGIGASTIYDLQRGDMRTTTRLHHVAAALGVTVAWLESGRGPRLTAASVASGEARAPYTVHGMLMTPEAARVAQEWEKLDEPMRTQVALIIESLVATQIRAARRKPAGATAAKDLR